MKVKNNADQIKPVIYEGNPSKEKNGSSRIELESENTDK